MSIHIGAKQGQIAETVLLPGDPKRAEWIAEQFLSNVIQYNSVRGMLGFTGVTQQGKRISVQGSGMGMPSLGIYVNELVDYYNVKNIIRVGSAGSLSEKIPNKSIIIAAGACSDSAMNNRRFYGMHFAPLASWNLLKRADQIATEMNITTTVGNIVSVDKFYEDVEPHTWKIFAEYNVLAIEMETAELYTLAAQKNFNALALLTISDNLVTDKHLSAEQREKGFKKMLQIALQF